MDLCDESLDALPHTPPHPFSSRAEVAPIPAVARARDMELLGDPRDIGKWRPGVTKKTRKKARLEKKEKKKEMKESKKKAMREEKEKKKKMKESKKKETREGKKNKKTNTKQGGPKKEEREKDVHAPQISFRIFES